jgi:GAF domain-containing protein
MLTEAAVFAVPPAGQPLSTQLGEAVLAATAVLGVDSVGLMLLDDQDGLQAVGASDALSMAFAAAQELLAEGPGMDAVRWNRSVDVRDLADATTYRRLWGAVEGSGTRALLSSPVRVAGELVGNLNAILCHPHPWSAGEIRAIEAYADVIGLLLALTAQASAQH